MLKRIGTSARIPESSAMMGTKVFLELYVKVQPGGAIPGPLVEELDWRRQWNRDVGAKNEEQRAASFRCCK